MKNMILTLAVAAAIFAGATNSTVMADGGPYDCPTCGPNDPNPGPGAGPAPACALTPPYDCSAE